MKKINKPDSTDKIKLTANILFSGVGCQERGFKDSGLFDLDVLNTSDINKDAVVSYAAVHRGLTNEMIENYSEYPSREEMVKYLKAINLGYEPEKNKSYDWEKLARRKSNDIEKYWLACKLSNNLGDISKIEKLPYADLWTCSFPCTDISLAGKMKGLSPSDSTRSSLLWENIRLLKTAKDDGTLPKYIMFENVKNLVGKKFINDFNNLLSVLDELGFNSYWQVLNAKYCGVPQHRERVFVVSFRNDIDAVSFKFPEPFYERTKIDTIIGGELINPHEEGISRTIKAQYAKTSQANFLRSGTFGATGVRLKNKSRKLTPSECWTLMGFDKEDCYKASAVGVSSANLYKQAGNGIVTNCCELIAEHLYKAQYNSAYICTDEFR